MDLKNELLILLVSSSPFFELRGSIPLGLAKGLEIWQVFIISVLGNMLVVIPLLFIFDLLIKISRKIFFLNKLFSWWFRRIEKKYYLIEKYGFFGLVILVAIPLPGSGAWTGCLASSLFEIKFLKSFLAICLGVLIAGIIVTLVSVGGFKLWSIFT